MERLGFSYEAILRQAERLCRRSHGLGMDAVDLAHEAVLHYLMRGEDSVDEGKGTPAMWAAGIVWNLWCGEVRRCVRGRSARSSGRLSDRVAESPLDQLIDQEDIQHQKTIGRHIRLWWDAQSDGRQRAIVRLAKKSLFGLRADRLPRSADYVAAHRARKELADLMRQADFRAW